MTVTLKTFFIVLLSFHLTIGGGLNSLVGTTRTRPTTTFSNIRFVNGTIDDDYFRLKRDGKDNTHNIIADIKKRLKETKPQRDEAESSAQNVYNDEQNENRREDKIRELQRHNSLNKHSSPGYNCYFENNCDWQWRKDIANGFYITAGGHLKNNETGPRADSTNRTYGSYLILRLTAKSTEFHLSSPQLGPTSSSCKLTMDLYQDNMAGGAIRVIGDKTITTLRGNSLNNHTQWVVATINGNNLKSWKQEELSIGKITTKFTIILEVVPPDPVVPPGPATIALDNLKFTECFMRNDEHCQYPQYQCKKSKECINGTSVCDFIKDCPQGDDEEQNCHVMPFGARCTFEEEDWCGWSNTNPHNILIWRRHNGSTPTNQTGPSFDHTFLNKSGNYLYVNMLQNQSVFASSADLRSVVFNPPPRVHGNISSAYYNTCAIRFYLHKHGKHKSAIKVEVTEFAPNENKTTLLMWSFLENLGDQWVRMVLLLPNITHRYVVHFEAKKGLRFMSDVAIDDVSMSPECFGVNIPEDELNGYNYWYPKFEYEVVKDTEPDFKNKTYFRITTCNTKGRFGPSHQNCTKFYNGTATNVKVLHEAGLSGIQKWNVPRDNYYTLILAGAGGGKGSAGMGSSRGAQVRTVLKLERGQELLVLAGQEGISACIKFIGMSKNNCSTNSSSKKPSSTLRDILLLNIIDSSGGGGGATYVFMRNRSRHHIPLAIAGGAGGLSFGHEFDNTNNYHGQGLVSYNESHSGDMVGTNVGGSGGGWYGNSNIQNPLSGYPLTKGGIGGKACYDSIDGRGDGGFGGGGGGCSTGGGGGGYTGGTVNSTNGDGGTSYVDLARAEKGFTKANVGHNTGSGYVVIVPAIEGGCGCNYMCLALDEKRSETVCVCPDGWKLGEDKKSCNPIISNIGSAYPPWFVVGLIITVFCLTIAFGMVCFVLYNRYQQQVSGLLRRKGCPATDVQLSRLRQASGSVTSQVNPNYEFGGIVTTLEDLHQIPREQLRLAKALGQGAFGEVFQGCYRQRPGDTVEMPVAVKTLQEMSVKQAEDDFLTEALIMSKFTHPNIVHFIGICFDRHPKFIVLELLSGGDLKNFLREVRPRPDRPSSINTKDLILIAMDIAKGCKYLEEKRFIHRDIAARNCLLTTKGLGRVAKIADFGMSRDIYRADYYRKDGKAMLPVKWMPPEAFLEGMFSSKTDVWSFGILMWEIWRLGFMPYTGCTNKEVMDLVVRGGRLEKPEGCPDAIYKIMYSCWNPKEGERPTFAKILAGLVACSNDPEILSTKLPLFYMHLLHESDTTIIRPSDTNDNCLQVVSNPSEYLVPTPSAPEPIESTSSVEKLIPDNSGDNWEPSFVLPNSKSTQPLLWESSDTPTSSQPKADVKSGVSLDASALARTMAKQHTIEMGKNGLVPNGTIKYLGPDGEVNC